MITKEYAKQALDNIIRKSRVHLYKPIQIAEILYHYRIFADINISDLETYRNKSKKWRDEMSILLLGRVCTSSAKFQDNLFEENAIPPEVLKVLGDENNQTKGAVESYIYNCFLRKHNQLANALDYCENKSSSEFYVKDFIDSFWAEPGLKRSLDKIYEIVVYSLFLTLIDSLELQIEVSMNENQLPLLREFEDFSSKVMCLDTQNLSYCHNAMVYRLGVTNAADRGLDMYSNWGPAIQIKHLSLDVELAEDIVSAISSDKIIIVCKDVEKKVIKSVFSQIGWSNRIQSIITEKDLVEWYDKALRGKYSSILSTKLLETLKNEIMNEFPSVNQIPNDLKERHYEKIKNSFWV